MTDKIEIGKKPQSPPAPDGHDPSLWQHLTEMLWFRGKRRIPWRTGKCGSWDLTDNFEEIYLDSKVWEEVGPPS